MKKLLVISLLALSLSAEAQLVTNSNVDLIWPQAVDDVMRSAWKVDTYCRTNGVSPYSTNELAQTYKQFLSAQVSYTVEMQAQTIQDKFRQVQEAVFLQAFRDIQNTNPAVFKRLWGIALKGEQ